jgi:hypothetical protein
MLLHLIIFFLLSGSPEPPQKLLKILLFRAYIAGGRGEDESRQEIIKI